ncbi:hypothetical protein D3C80_1516510 [compost metagenome]
MQQGGLQPGQAGSAFVQLPAGYEDCPWKDAKLPFGQEGPLMLHQSENVLGQNVGMLKGVAAALQRRGLKLQLPMPPQAGDQALFKYP